VAQKQPFHQPGSKGALQNFSRKAMFHQAVAVVCVLLCLQGLDYLEEIFA
jgi:hypothetical protein